ncbi:MAG: exodeoxyribonuclease VII small subunit [Paludibacter sp.]|nr:exodeoxyribonuclease VII small subunit [Paludibacter sp.]
MKNDKLTYTDAVSELEAILRALENTEEVDMDRISASVKRASELMEFCKKKLHTLDEALEKMIAEL